MITKFSKAMLAFIEINAPADTHRHILKDLAAAEISQYVRQVPQIMWEEFKVELHGWINFDEETSKWSIPMLVIDGRMVDLVKKDDE